MEPLVGLEEAVIGESTDINAASEIIRLLLWKSVCQYSLWRLQDWSNEGKKTSLRDKIISNI